MDSNTNPVTDGKIHPPSLKLTWHQRWRRWMTQRAEERRIVEETKMLARSAQKRQLANAMAEYLAQLPGSCFTTKHINHGHLRHNKEMQFAEAYYFTADGRPVKVTVNLHGGVTVESV